jgi:hypothetical protein
MQLVGASATPEIVGLQELAGKSNYFLGDDPQGWFVDVPTYGLVEYRDVYAGINLVYLGNQQQLRYDFILAPGADPNTILLNFEGVQSLAVNSQGELVLSTAAGELRHLKPFIYQEVDGVRQEIAGGYVVTGANQVGFQVAAYDTSKPLVIDPTLAYSTFLGGSNEERGQAIAVDAAGNAYVTGFTMSSSFPTVAGSFDTSLNSNGDVFVTKLNATGTALIYSTFIGGNQAEQGYGIAVDSSGNAYVTGFTSSAASSANNRFPTTDGTGGTVAGFDTSHNGGRDVFVTKLNATGSALIYSTFLGGSGDDEGRGIALDSSGNAYVTGYTESDSLATTGAADTTRNGRDAFVAKFDPTASGAASRVYFTYLGGGSSEEGYGIAVDASGNAYVTGFTESSSSFATAGAADTTHGGGRDAFITKLNAAGSSFVYSTYLGGSSIDEGRGIAVDAAGNAYVTGFTESNGLATTGAFDTTRSGRDAFVTKLNAAGSSFVYSTYLGGNNPDEGYGIAVDATGNAYVTGFTESTSPNPFPTTSDAIDTTHNGNRDVFVTYLNTSGTALVFSTYLGHSSNEEGMGIAVHSGGVYVTGYTQSSSFPTTAGAFDTSYNTNGDAFVLKLEFPVIQFSLAAYQVNEDGTPVGTPVTVTRSTTTGTSQVQVTFPGTGTATPVTDYGNTAITVTLNDGENSKTVIVPIIDDTIVEGTESLGLALTAVSNAMIGTQSTATLEILDNDTATISFQTASSSVAEDVAGGTHDVGVTLTITGNGVAGMGTLGAEVKVDVDDLLTGSAAVGGTDYSFTDPTTLTFAAGAASGTQNVTLSINNDTIVEGDETVNLALADLQGIGSQVSITTPDTHQVTITDNDTATVSFEFDSSTAPEGTTPHLVAVKLTITGNGVAGTGTLGAAVSVDVVDLGTGTADLTDDYTYTSPQTVTFLSGEGSGTKTVSLGIVDDGDPEGDETVELGLENLADAMGGQVSLVAPTGHTVTIVDNDTATNSDPVIEAITSSSPDCGCNGSIATTANEVTVTFTFSDVDAGDTHQYSVDWGDGTTTPLTDTSPGTVTVGHVYGQGGVFTLTLTVEDNHGGSDTATTTAIVTGVRLSTDGTLYVIGTNAKDQVQVSRSGSQIKLQAELGSTKVEQYFAYAVVQKIHVLLCDGDDQSQIGSDVNKDSSVDGGKGNDQIQVDGHGNHTVHGGHGDDQLQISGNGNHFVTGGAGNDQIQLKGYGNNIILGGDGADVIQGGKGRELIIGGKGTDKLMGNDNDDIIIGGFTDWDDAYEALEAILTEWGRTDRTFTQRVEALRDGANGYLGPLLNDTKVHDDGVTDELSGNNGVDWFFANLVLDAGDDSTKKDKVTDASNAEKLHWVDIDFTWSSCS